MIKHPTRICPLHGTPLYYDGEYFLKCIQKIKIGKKEIDCPHIEYSPRKIK